MVINEADARTDRKAIVHGVSGMDVLSSFVFILVLNCSCLPAKDSECWRILSLFGLADLRTIVSLQLEPSGRSWEDGVTPSIIGGSHHYIRLDHRFIESTLESISEHEGYRSCYNLIESIIEFKLDKGRIWQSTGSGLWICQATVCLHKPLLIHSHGPSSLWLLLQCLRGDR